MAKVNLTVMKYEGKWTVRMDDGRAVQYIGATDSQSVIEAFAAKLMTDLIAAGDIPVLTVDRASVTTRSAKQIALNAMFPSSERRPH